VVDALDRPLLFVAAAAVALYLLELRGVVDPKGPARALSIALDLVFVADVTLKIAAQGRRYLTSAWSLVDLLSCLPALALLGHLPFLDAIRFTRLFRFLRVLRSVRVLRAMHSVPALQRFAAEAEQNREGLGFRIALNAGVAVYAGAFLAVLAWVDGHEPPELAAQIEFYLVLGALLATALFIYVMHHQLQDASLGQIRALLNIALPRQVADHFMTHPEAFHDKSRAKATILFMDFVGFTKTSEKLGADVQKLSDHLEAVMDCVVERLVAHDLIIDKFMGDGIMAFRGGPLVAGDEREHARRVVKGALDGRRALLALNDPYFPAIKIGGASAEVLIGAFGTSRRLSYTVLGDGVNLAARLEPACGQCSAEALFCDATRQLCGDDPGIVWRTWGRVRVKGKAAPQPVHEAFDPRDVPDQGFITLYAEALAAWTAHEVARARALFVQADAARPGGDPPSRQHVAWCDELIATGLPLPAGFDASLTVAK
jgi:class 3 adenylate cyclase